MKTRTWLSLVLFCVAILLLQRSAVAGEHEFRYRAADAKTVELMCEFNGWKGVPMTKDDSGVWTVKVDLPSGKHAYKFLIDGKDWVLDPSSSEKKSVDGVENSAVEID